MISYSDQYDTGDANGFSKGSATYYGVTTAPDGSSVAEGYTNTGTLSSRSMTTLTRTDLTCGYDIYSYSSYIKPIDSIYTRTLLFLYMPDTDPWSNAAIQIDFTNSEIHSMTQRGASQTLWNFSYEESNNGWFFVSFIFDARNYNPDSRILARLYPNEDNPYWASGHGCYFWGTTVNKTKLRNVVAPVTLTESSITDHSDFISVDFTQLPSNLGEVENDIHTTKTYLDGNFSRASVYIDKEVKTIAWEKIDYTKHGKMIYNLRESLRDKIGQDCILEYPSGFKSQIHSAKIRVVDFRFTYTSINNIANVELDYYIVDTYSY